MFDIGFWELVLIGVIALLVFGPEKLPRLARTAGYWIGKARRQLHEFRAEFEREVALDEVRRLQEKLEVPGLKEVTEGVRSVTSFDPLEKVKSALSPGGDRQKPGE